MFGLLVFLCFDPLNNLLYCKQVMFLLRDIIIIIYLPGCPCWKEFFAETLARTPVDYYRMVLLVESNVGRVQIVVCETEAMNMLDCRPEPPFEYLLVKAGGVMKKAMIQDLRESVESNTSDVSTVDYTTMV
jgi:hypothetical protein